MLFLKIAGILAVLLAVGAVLHATYYKAKKNAITPSGQLVDVFDGQMHLFKQGNGKRTIVLLPGLGDALPSADFAPLMRCLSQDYTVVCVEYFGMGFSTQTARERTCENYVEEIRTALTNAGMQAPYILMPHSISSVYSEYYAYAYPDEVKAIISLDGTSTAYVGADMPRFVKAMLGVAKVQQTLGLTSILASLTAKKAPSLACGYTEKEIDALLAFAGFSINDTVLEQMRHSIDFVTCTNATTYPTSVPYFKVISKQTYQTPNKQIPLSPQAYQQEHLARVGAENHYEILDGTHFIYQNNVQNIKRITDAFVSQLP